MSNLQQELPAIGFLAEVSSEHRSFLATFGRFLRPQSGEVLIAAGEPQDSLYVILSGSVHITSEVNGRPMLLASLSGGDSIGEINLFDPATASATAICRTAGLVWALSHQELDEFVADDPEAGVSVLRGLLAEMARRIRGMNDKLATAEQRASMHNFWSDPKA
ncbi:MAG: cyclic nucleotide-binding domain-containing protein [Verrucomicrobia bacterium]|nr:cyclic nucleotide-binding domain-containing protein [Verrucomicrobiota bacterium]